VKRLAELDGLRGLAALAVLVAHLFGEPEHGWRGLSLGWLGVSVFFALSGYLIGGIILDDLGKPGFFRGFFTRRAARILPIYGVVVVLTLLALVLVSGAPWADVTLHPAAYLTFTTNILIASGQDGGAWLLPTWTVAVEEQFYLLLPLLVAFTPRKHLLWVLATLCAASIAYRGFLAPIHAEAAGMLLPGRADTLLYGVIAACLQRSVDMSRRVHLVRYAGLAALAGLVGVLASGNYALTVVLSPALVGLATASLILLAALGEQDLRAARWPLLAWFGTISYGLYLVHQPISGLLHGLILNGRPDVGSGAQIAVTLLAAAVSIAVAWASWRGFEKPILDLSRRGAHRAMADESGHGPPAPALAYEKPGPPLDT
jgi:peptidoglycan/LPS O-acetylase OafA/YrhL